MKRIIGKYIGNQRGPMLIVFGGIHGNETAGIQSIKYALKMLEVEPITNPDFVFKGSFIGIAGNLKAIKSNERYIHQDLNRMWTKENIEYINSAPKENLNDEFWEMRDILDEISKEIERYKPQKIVVLDLHTTSSYGGIFTIVTDDPESLRIGLDFHAPVIKGMMQGLSGTILHYYNTANIGIETTVLTFESGQHEEKLSINRAIAATINCMKSIGNVKSGDVENIHNDILVEYSKGLPKVTVLLEKHSIEDNDQFEMKPSYNNFQKVKRGEILATDKNGDIKANKDAMILMPLYQKKGKDGFFIVKELQI